MGEKSTILVSGSKQHPVNSTGEHKDAGNNGKRSWEHICQLLRKNCFTPLPEKLKPSLKSLTVVDLSNNCIRELPEAIGELVLLNTLRIEHNALEDLPSTVGQLLFLKELYVSHNKLTSLPDACAHLHALELLDASHNSIAHIPLCVQIGCARINRLDFSYNFLTKWDAVPMCVHGLKILNIANNKLQKNPEWLWHDLCHSLEHLDVSENDFSNIGSVFKPNEIWRTGVRIVLRELNIASCGLTSNHLPLINELKALTRLNIGNNPRHYQDFTPIKKDLRCSGKNAIWDLPFKSLSCQLVLTDLSLCGVGLAIIPEEVSCLKALQVLDVRENNLHWLPGGFCELSCLRTAVFSKNRLICLPSDFGKLRSLEELYLDQNMLESLPDSFSNLKGLRWLDLYANVLEDIPCALEALLVSLKGVDLGMNRFNIVSVLTEKASVCSPDSYRALRSALRQRCLFGSDTESQRSDGVQHRSEYSSSFYSCCTSDDESDSDESCSSESVVSNQASDSNQAVECDEENWDWDEGIDDYFDPTVMPEPPFVPHQPTRALLIFEHLIGPDSFCPSDIHALPSPRPSKDVLKPDEGQFEDV